MQLRLTDQPFPVSQALLKFTALLFLIQSNGLVHQNKGSVFPKPLFWVRKGSTLNQSNAFDTIGRTRLRKIQQEKTCACDSTNSLLYPKIVYYNHNYSRQSIIPKSQSNSSVTKCTVVPSLKVGYATEK